MKSPLCLSRASSGLLLRLFLLPAAAGAAPYRNFEVSAYSDPIGEHLVTEERNVTATDVLTLRLASAGGAVTCLDSGTRR